MALQKNMTLVDNFNESIDFPNCYIRVDAVNASKVKALVTVGFYKKDKTSLLVSNLYEFTPIIENTNIFEQAYKNIKKLPEFVDAVDC